MEFLLYLSPEAKNLLNKIYQAKFSVRENIEYCRNKEIFGYVDFGKKVVICTKNIKSSGYNVYSSINQTFLHESVHVAHMCNGYRPFGISVKDMPLSNGKMSEVNDSLAVSSATRAIEHEAHWMENKPKKINNVIQKYCF